MKVELPKEERGIYTRRKTATLGKMLIFRILLGFGVTAALCCCTSYQMGNDHAGDNGSYTGATLNSPTTDQNPHVGGDSSYPSSVSDQGRQQVPPEKTDY